MRAAHQTKLDFCPFLPPSRRRSEAAQQQVAQTGRDFRKGCLMNRGCKYPFRPQPTPHGRDGVRERHHLFVLTPHSTLVTPTSRQFGVPHGDHAIQPKQTRCGSQHRWLRPPPRLLQLQVRTHLLEGRLDVPAARIVFHHLPRRQRVVGAEEVLGAMRAAFVLDVDPTHGHQAFPRAIPLPTTADHGDVASPAAVPGHIQPLPPGLAGDDVLRRRLFVPFAAWPARLLLAGHSGWRGIQGGVGIEAADQAQPPPMTGGEACQVVAGEVAIGGADEVPLGEPMAQHGQQLPQQFRGRFVPPAVLSVPLFGAIQGGQDRQGPGADGEGERHQDGQNHPLVPPAKGGVGVRRAHGVAVPRLAVNVLAFVFGHGVVARQGHGAVGQPVTQDVAGPRRVPDATASSDDGRRRDGSWRHVREQGGRGCAAD